MYFCINPRRSRGFIQDLDPQSEGLCFINGFDVVIFCNFSNYIFLLVLKTEIKILIKVCIIELQANNLKPKKVQGGQKNAPSVYCS